MASENTMVGNINLFKDFNINQLGLKKKILILQSFSSFNGVIWKPKPRC